MVVAPDKRVFVACRTSCQIWSRLKIGAKFHCFACEFDVRCVPSTADHAAKKEGNVLDDQEFRQPTRSPIFCLEMLFYNGKPLPR